MQTAKRPELTGCSFDDVEAGDILITPVTKFLVTEKEHIRFNGSSSLKKGYHLTLGEPINVDTIRYDDWAIKNSVGSIDLAWIDVQGAERDVIEGMGAVIENVKHIWIEFGEMQYEGAMSFTETVDLMKSKGFALIGTSTTNPVNNSGDALFKFGADT